MGRESLYWDYLTELTRRRHNVTPKQMARQCVPVPARRSAQREHVLRPVNSDARGAAAACPLGKHADSSPVDIRTRLEEDDLVVAPFCICSRPTLPRKSICRHRTTASAATSANTLRPGRLRSPARRSLRSCENHQPLVGKI